MNPSVPVLPEYLNRLADTSPESSAWVKSLPELIQNARDEWGIDSIIAPIAENASSSYVARVGIKDKGTVVLKINHPDYTTEHEIAGLISLGGQHSVRVLASNMTEKRYLMEELVPGTSLKSLPEPEQDPIVCATLKHIWDSPGFPGMRSLHDMVRNWTYDNPFSAYPDPELAAKGNDLKFTLSSTSKDQVFLATDLHAGNILKGRNQEWIAIDIKPFYGDRAYDLTQHILNCLDRLESDPKGFMERIAVLGDVDPDRLGKWVYARLATENFVGARQVLANNLEYVIPY